MKPSHLPLAKTSLPCGVVVQISWARFSTTILWRASLASSARVVVEALLAGGDHVVLRCAHGERGAQGEPDEGERGQHGEEGRPEQRLEQPERHAALDQPARGERQHERDHDQAPEDLGGDRAPAKR